MRTVLLLLVLPLVFVAPALLPGQRFLPILPAAYAPLSIEDPAAAQAARVDANYLATDRLLPFLTDDIAIRAAWRAFSIPTWEPRLGLGLPLAAGSARGTWYPPNFLSTILAPDVAAGFEALIALFLAGLGMYAFSWTRGVSRSASLFGAWGFQAGAFALVNLHLSMKVDAALWLPFALLGIERIVTRQRYGGVICAAAIALSFLAGFPPIALFVTASALLYAAWRAIEKRSAHTGVLAAAWIVLGVLAAAVAWLPMLEASSESLRAGQGAEQTAAQSLPPAALGTLLRPDLFGRATATAFAAHDPVTWWLTAREDAPAAVSANALEWNLFAGISVLLLAIAGVAARTRAAAFPLVLLLLSLGFALGWPLVSLLYHVPGFDLGAPSRASSVAWVAWPILAALGLDALVAGEKRAKHAVFVAAAILAIGSGILALTFSPDEAARDLPDTLAIRHGVTLQTVSSVIDPTTMLTGFLRVQAGLEQLALVAIAALIALLLTLRLAPRSTILAALPWLALAAGEGFLIAREHLAPRLVEQGVIFPRSDAMGAIAEAAGDGRVVRYDDSKSGIGDVEELARPNLLAAYGIRDLTPYTVFTPKSLIELVGTADPQSLHGSGISRISDVKHFDLRVLDLLRVTCVLSREPLRSPRLQLVWSRPGFCVHTRTGSMPRARVAPPVPIVAASRDTALQLVADPLRDPRESIVIASDDMPPEALRPQHTDTFEPGEVELSAPAPHRLDARVTGSSGGWLVFHEQWYPGWKATVNGADAPVVRVDHVLRAVPVPPGDSVVRTKYEPGSLRLGGALTLGAILVAAIAVLLERRRWRNSSLGPPNVFYRSTNVVTPGPPIA